MVKHQKVYWIKGFPNNGVGEYLYKIPLINKHLVKDKTGKIILCKNVYELSEAIKNKRRVVKEMNEAGFADSHLNDIYYNNKLHLSIMEAYAGCST